MSQTLNSSEACLKIVMTQTNYDKDMATQKLKEWDNDFINVIKEYLNPKFQEKKAEKKITTNQKIIEEIRKFKDKQDGVYLEKKNYKNMLQREIFYRDLELQKEKNSKIVITEKTTEDK
tara:strand:+ start:4758 stop:5114 length:357 start_codon:yes stop_codon:yes gene_type:complete